MHKQTQPYNAHAYPVSWGQKAKLIKQINVLRMANPIPTTKLSETKNA